MKTQSNSLAVLLAIILLAGLGYGAYVLLGDIYHYTQHLSAELLTILGVVLFSVLFLGLAIRYAGRHQGMQRFQLEKKAQCYASFIQACHQTTGTDDRAIDQIANINAELKLWASVEVIRQLKQLDQIEPDWSTNGVKSISAIEPVVRAMRNDLSQHNLRLSVGDLSW